MLNAVGSPQIAYICFDVVPAPKGAATHIEAFAQALHQSFADLHLVTVAPAQARAEPPTDYGFNHVQFPCQGKTLLDRVLHFRQQLAQWLQGKHFDVIQVRSIYEGFLIAQDKYRWCDRLIFEVNGLPSIELKYRYPKVADDRELMDKLLSQEQQCLTAADCIITPSPVTRDYLIQRQISPQSIQVIANGVDLSRFTYQPPRPDAGLAPLRSLYFGTLAPWQGTAIAVEALALYCRDFEATLTLIGPARPSQGRALDKLAQRLDVADRVTRLDPLPQADLVQQIHQADVVLAPLTANDRNLVQGCCPLKVLEAMATGTPVITSAIPTVQALAPAGKPTFLAVRPGSAKALKDGLLQLRANPELRSQLAVAARQHVEDHYTWPQAGRALVGLYRRLLAVGC